MAALIDFQQVEEVHRWRSINDRVMGGCSWGELRHEGGLGVFCGEVSLANNGGFASVRRAPQVVEPGDALGVTLRVRGDGRRYQLRLKNDDALDGVLYRAYFHPPAGQWHTEYLGWEEFEAVFRGRVRTDAPPLQPAVVRQFGLMTGDKTPGPFRLALAWIEYWSGQD